MTFTPASTRRVINTVQSWEKYPKNLAPPRRGRRGLTTGTRQAVVTEAGGIDGGDSGEVELYIDGQPTGNLFTAWHNWIYGVDGVPEKVSEGKRCYIEKFFDDGKFRITGADCETEPAPAPPGHAYALVAAGTTQETALEIGAHKANRVETAVAGVSDSIRLPDDYVQDDDILILNKSGVTINIFPDEDGYINDVGPDLAVTLPDEGSIHLFVGKITTERYWVS